MAKIKTVLLLLLLLSICSTAEPVRLPRPRADTRIWGALINQFLRVSHNEDGTLKASALDGLLDEFGITQANGYLGIDEPEPATLLDVNGVITALVGNSTEWNTAYGWGDHSGQGYLTTVAFGDVTGNAADVITAGDHIAWAADTLNVADDWYDAVGDIPSATPSNGDTTHLSTADEIYDWVIGLTYLKADGSVPLAGAWDMGSQNLTNVNIDGGTIDVTGQCEFGDVSSLFNLEARRDLILTGGVDTDLEIRDNAIEWFHIEPTGGGAITVDAPVGAMTLSDSGNSITIAEAEAAHDHSQLGSGNPHSVTPTELNLVIGTDVQAFGAVLDDLNTLGASTADGEFLVATGAGVFAWESGSTARDSLSLGTGDSPGFTAETLSGATPLDLTANISTINYGDGSVTDQLIFQGSADTGPMACYTTWASTAHGNTLNVNLTASGSAFSTAGNLSFSSDDLLSFTANTAAKSITLNSPEVKVDGILSFKGKTGSGLTIATGSVTPTKTYQTVATEGGDPSDDLDTIVGIRDGQILIIRPASPADDTVVVKNGTGNIVCGKTGGDVTLDDNTDTFMAVYDITLEKWLEL